MATPEFDLIREFFTPQAARRSGVMLGVGDDCALLEVPAGMELAVTIDTLVAGIHFPDDTAAVDVGHKALAVGLSDLAAMGARPTWATLAMTLPRLDREWLHGFAGGLFSLAGEHGVVLVGGDTTHGPVTTVTVQLHGLVAERTAMRRRGARPGDLVYVTGTLGDAALALRLLRQGARSDSSHVGWLRRRLDRPAPRVEQGSALRGLASACIDISDGLLADLGHVLEASGVGARLELERIPLSGVYRACAEAAQDPYLLPLTGGDDYELCFTLPAGRREKLERLFATRGWSCQRIGVIEREPGLRCSHPDGSPYLVEHKGYDHFAQG